MDYKYEYIANDVLVFEEKASFLGMNVKLEVLLLAHSDNFGSWYKRRTLFSANSSVPEKTVRPGMSTVTSLHFTVFLLASCSK